MNIYLHKNDLPGDVTFNDAIAVDTETMGLKLHRDRLCVVQIGDGQGNCHLIQLSANTPQQSPRLIALMRNEHIQKIFHFARFDMGMLLQHLHVMPVNIFCTKIASRLVRTYTDRHGLKNLCQELLKVELSKQEQSSDWGQDCLTVEQQRYAAQDVLYLHALKEKLMQMLIRENRLTLAQHCFDFLPQRVQLDLWGLEDTDIFSHGA